MAEQGRQLRLAVHYSVTLHRGGSEGRGATENLSERGAMLSTDMSPPPAAGEELELDLHLPSMILRLAARVQWTSTVLPGMIGVEFHTPVADQYLAHYDELCSQGMGQAS